MLFAPPPPHLMLRLALALLFAAAASAPAAVVEGAHRFDVRCGETATTIFTLPPAAQDVQVLDPVVGERVLDGFGELEVATVQDVRQGAGAVDITVVGTGATCDGPGAWLTGPVGFRASYNVPLDPTVVVSDEQAGMHPRVRPRQLSAGAGIGWRKLRWRTWGGDSAVARGLFRTLRWVPIGHTDVEQRPFTYTVEVTLSRIRLCGDHRRSYTRIATRFLSRAPRSVRRQARPLSTAGCLRVR